MAKQISECERIEKLIKNPANRIVQKPMGLGFEVHNAAGKILLHAYDDTTATVNTMGFHGGFYEPDFTRSRLTNQWQHYLLFDTIKAQFAAQKVATVQQTVVQQRALGHKR